MSFLSISSLSFGQKTYINKYKSTARSLSVKYGIPSSVILGVAVVESSSGQNRNSKLLKNHFGIAGKNNLRKKGYIRSINSIQQLMPRISTFVKLSPVNRSIKK